MIILTSTFFSQYIKSSVTKAHVTNHQVKGPTYTKPIVKVRNRLEAIGAILIKFLIEIALDRFFNKNTCLQ